MRHEPQKWVTQSDGRPYATYKTSDKTPLANLSGFLFSTERPNKIPISEIKMKFRAICENHLYSKAYSKGKRAVTSALAVYVLPDYAAKRLAKSHPEKKIVNRIGLTTSKALGGAVVRSRARRVLREGLRQVEKERPLKVGFLIVIAARHAATTAKSTDIKSQLIEAFTKLGMFKE
jgi:ribonuclease P protein component